MRVFFLIVMTLPAAWAQRVFDIPGDFSYSFMNGYIYTWTDSSMKAGIQDLDPGKFTLWSKDNLNFGTNGLQHWIMFQCRNPGSEVAEVVADLDVVYLNNLDYYIFAGDSLIRKQEGLSWKTPRLERELRTRYFGFPLQAAPGITYRVFIRAQKTYGFLFFPLTLFSADEHRQNYYVFDIVFYSAVSILSVIALMAIFFFFSYRQRLILYYTLYLGACILYALTVEGVITRVFPGLFNSSRWSSVFSLLTGIMNIFFALHFVLDNGRSAYRWLNYFYRVFAGVLAALLSYALLGDYSEDITRLQTYVTSFIPLVLLLVIDEGVCRHRRRTLVFVLASLPVHFSSLLIIARLLDIFNLDHLPDNFSTYLFRYVAPVIEFVILGVSILMSILSGNKKLLARLSGVQKEMISIQEKERQRIARDLHDELGGIFAAFNSRISTLQELDNPGKIKQQVARILETSQNAGEKIRQISHNLLPPELEKAGLFEAVKELITESRHPVFRVSLFGNERRMSSERELNVYRILSELLTNIRRHSGAETARIQFFYHPDMLTITLEDDGQNQASHYTPGLGLKTIHTRLAYLNGHLLNDQNGSFRAMILNIPYR